MTSLPKQYQWLNNIETLPRTIREGLNLFGVVEHTGTANSPTIMAWAKEVGLNQSYSADSIPWCGLYAAVVAKRAGKTVVESPLWARNWAKFGEKADQASLGDVLVFVRKGGGHVGFYIGEDATAYHVLGGNQSDKVCITRILKSRCIAVRRPKYLVKPLSVKPFIVSNGGLGISTNEA